MCETPGTLKLQLPISQLQIPQFLNFPIAQCHSGFFQLGILLHQLLQPEPWELYRNLGVFPISFSLIDGALAVFGMANFLPGAEAFFALRFLHSSFRKVELLSTRGEELRNIVDGVVALP